MQDLKKHIEDLSQKSSSVELNKRKIKAFEIHNLYIDNEENIELTNSILEKVKSLSCSYAYAFHDKDFYTEKTFNSQYQLIGNVGELKKPHYHLYVVLNSNKTISDIASEFNITCNRVQSFKEKHFRNKILYLTHICYSPLEKYIYDKDIIVSNVMDYVNYVYETFNPIKNIYQIILEKIDNSQSHYIKKRDILELIMSYDLTKEYEKHYKLIIDLIEEHNYLFRDEITTRKQLERDRENCKAKEIIKQKNILDAFGILNVDENNEIIYKVKKKEKKQ